MKLVLPLGVAKVRVAHYRCYMVKGKPSAMLWKTAHELGVHPCLAKGGMTKVTLFDENEQVMVVGRSRCNQKDNYNRSLGRMIAFGRALKELNVKQSG